MGQAQINVRTLACRRTFIAGTKQAALTHNVRGKRLTISVLQACCAVTTEYGIPSDIVRKSTASFKIKISTAQVNFSNWNVIIF